MYCHGRPSRGAPPREGKPFHKKTCNVKVIWKSLDINESTFTYTLIKSLHSFCIKGIGGAIQLDQMLTIGDSFQGTVIHNVYI